MSSFGFFSLFFSVLFITCLLICNRPLCVQDAKFCHQGKLLTGGFEHVVSSQFEPCPFLWPCQGRARLRKPKKHKRRLAYARSGLVYNFGGSKENEYWNFPLPPISPTVPTLTGSASVMDVWPLNSQVKVLT